MKSFKIIYLMSQGFFQDKGGKREWVHKKYKKKEEVVFASNRQKAEEEFMGLRINFHKILAVEMCTGNVIGEMFPELMKLKNKLK
jgi:hypothetical protein